MSLGLERGVCGANVLEGEPRARPRRAPPGPEGAARPGAGPGGRATTPGGRSGASSPSPVGAFQQLPGLSRGPDPEGGHLKGLPGSLPSCIMKGHTRAQRRKPPSPACRLRVLRVRAHTLRAHTRAVAARRTRIPQLCRPLLPHATVYKDFRGAPAPPAGDEETGPRKGRDLAPRPVASSQTPPATGQAPRGPLESPDGSGEIRAGQTAWPPPLTRSFGCVCVVCLCD